MSRSNHFAFTLNNYTDDDITKIGSLVDDSTCTYLCYGKEVGEQGTPHLQGYIQFASRIRLTTAKTRMGISRLHLEPCRGSDEDNRNYCSKDGDFIEFGVSVAIARQRVGGQCDYQALIQQIQDGTIASLRDIPVAFPKLWLKHHTAIEKTYFMFRKPEARPYYGPFRWSVEHDWNTSLHLWGAAGIGKTAYARTLLPKALFVSHIDQLKAYNADFDGIIFDDMAFLHLPREAQIHLLDVDNGRAIHVRYGIAFIPPRTKKLFLSNLPDIFLNDPAINRRKTVICLDQIHNIFQ
jgi:hypothetical protein